MDRLKALILFLLGLSCGFSRAQVAIEPASGDFGIISRTSERLLDFELRNNGREKAIVLRTELGPECSFLYSSREIAPDSAIHFRIKINPVRKGNFNTKGRIWLSTMKEPLEIELKAVVEHIDRSDNTACPDFRSKPASCCEGWDVVVQVLDAQTSLPLCAARLRIVRNGFVVEDLRSDTKGEALIAPEPGWYSLFVQKPGYLPSDTAGYLNKRTNVWQIYLQPQSETVRVQPKEEEEDISPPDAIISVLVSDEPGPATEFTEANFTPNNLVFLVDVSQSMAGSGKLDLLKNSMYSLIAMLRSVDRVSLISYASGAELLLDGVSGAEKALLIGEVGALNAAGMTSGARAFETAYEQARREFITGGNNQVFVITDGAFRSGDNARILAMAAESKNFGIETSVIAVLPKGMALESLSFVAESGGGRVLELRSLEEAETLLNEEIKIQSRKR